VWYRGLAADAGVSASLAASLDIDSAVTFGVRRPAILVPGRLLEAPEPHQRAIVAHELHHVARRDWVWVLAEEALRIALWWHPAIWFALGEAQLAREEIVDRRTIAATGNRTGYLEALIAAADSAPAGALGFGPQFYRRRQLFTRVRRLLQEETMSNVRVFAVAAALAIAVPATVFGVSAAFPLTAAERAIAPQDQPPPPPPPPQARSSGRDDAPPPPPPPRPSRVRTAPVTMRDQPPPPPPKPVDEKVVTVSKGDAAARKAAEKEKPTNPTKDVDVKVKSKVDATVTKNTVKSAVPKPAGAETKKASKSEVKTEPKPATKPAPVRKGGGGQPRA
jgi:hypothetical protein